MGQIVFAGGILQHILINPADTGGVRAQSRVDPGGQLAADIIKVFQDPGSGPIDIGAVFKDDVDQRDTELGKAAHYLGLGDGQHGGGQRIGDLVLHHKGSLFGEFGGDNDLDIGKIGDGIDGEHVHGVEPPGGD